MSSDAARQSSTIFDGQRLDVARRARKMSRRELADEVRVSPSAVSQWEKGKARPRPELVDALATALDFPVPYFATTGRDLKNLDSECSFFRSLRQSTQRDRDAAMAHATLIAELVLVIERHAALPPATIPLIPADESTSLEDIDSIADQVRDEWGLDENPIDDVIRTIEIHGCVTARLSLADTVDAFSWPGNGRPIVILGVEKENRIRSRFDAAHELGHLVMHRDSPRPADPRLERQAHRFANAFLLPASRLEDEWPKGGRVDWRALLELKRTWNISLQALLYRARQTALISETTYASATRYLKHAGWKITEPGDEGPPERPRLLDHAVRVLDDAGFDLDDLAAEARLPRDLVEIYVDPGVPRRIAVEL